MPDNLLAYKGNRPLNYRLRSARAITMRWIWFVPSYIWVVMVPEPIPCGRTAGSPLPDTHATHNDAAAGRRVETRADRDCRIRHPPDQCLT